MRAMTESQERAAGDIVSSGGLRPVAVERPRVLVVDDDETITDLLVEALSAERYHVDVARTCEDALPLILFHAYSGILLDLVLPGTNGLSFFREIARRRPELAARVVFLTGALERDEAGRFVRLVDNPVVLKPFDPGEVVAVVRRLDRGPSGPPA